MDKKYMNKCSILLHIRDMQIKTTLIDLTLDIRDIIKNNNNNKYWGECEEKENLTYF
jgi:hypothetical protein